MPQSVFHRETVSANHVSLLQVFVCVGLAHGCWRHRIVLEESCSLTQPVCRLEFGNVPVGSGVSLSSCTFFLQRACWGRGSLFEWLEKASPRLAEHRCGIVLDVCRCYTRTFPKRSAAKALQCCTLTFSRSGQPLNRPFGAATITRSLKRSAAHAFQCCTLMLSRSGQPLNRPFDVATITHL